MSIHSVRAHSQTLDCNALSATEPLRTRENHYIGLFVDNESGSHTTHEIQIQESIDGTEWFNCPITLVGLGCAHGDIAAEFVRAVVTTAEGAPSSVKVGISTK